VSGRILVHGRDLRDYDLVSYRTQISLVQQEPLMFDDTIRKNLEFGLPQPLGDPELRDILRRAHCLEFVDALPQGVDTMIGERAVRLSGGQRQRLALARALANRPALLLLDEPTSALDSVSEQAIQQTLRDLHGQVTVVVVAHRLSTIIDADRILVLQDGRVMAEGTHDALMHRGGVYHDLFKAQVSILG
jgi:ABC-type multidrug transport system fused ATPase/permease subunit